eukprot:GFUD01009411.1.p1 GENE.GFUD01009411.1~~GFUD01009411.1.p1  ORF type:complete len:510 (+),score=126.28 GFUD01009411.1:48-1577(+)
MWIEILIFLGLLCLWFYHYCTKQFDEFKKRGMPFAKPSFPFGSSNAKSALMGEVSFFDVDRALAANEFKDEKIFGYFMMGQPTVVINDEELAKRIMVKDFDHFTDLRPMGYEAETKDAKIMKYQMAGLKGEQWKKVRSIMSGVFSSGKLKLMTPHIVMCGQQLEAYMTPLVEKGEELEARHIASLFTIDAMATSGYGLEINSFENPENTFRKMALTLVGAPGYGSSMDMMRMVFIMTAPSLAKLLGIPIFPKQPCLFLSNIIEKAYRQRMNSGEKRNDIIDVIVEEMNTSDLSKDFTEEEKELLLVAQAFILFMAGFDSASMMVSMAIHHLVIHEDVQKKLLAEIDTVLEEADGEVTHDVLQEMKYLDRVIQETGRYKTLMTSHERMCTKDYAVPETNIIIPRGRMVKVYFTPFENSKKNFKNPGQFDPDNFLPENNPNKFGYMAFGQGPRACPAQRYALLAMKIFLVHFLRNHRLVASAKSNMGDIELDPNAIIGIKGGVWFKLEKRI